MNTSRKGIISMTVLFTAAVLCCSRASATTVTYNFGETGWVNTAGTTENFSGSFIGTPDANGNLDLTTLTDFTATLTETNSVNDTKTIAAFGGLTGTPGLTDFLFSASSGSLTLAATGSPGALICLGNAVAEGLCGGVAPRPVSTSGVPAPPIEGLFISSINDTLNAYTTALPSVTLTVSPVATPVPQPTGTSTPEPASFLLCGSALLLTSMVLRRYRGRRTITSRCYSSRSAELGSVPVALRAGTQHAIPAVTVTRPAAIKI
jgi:hypothetical protein